MHEVLRTRKSPDSAGHEVGRGSGGSLLEEPFEEGPDEDGGGDGDGIHGSCLQIAKKVSREWLTFAPWFL
jgi:hypothetical protein